MSGTEFLSYAKTSAKNLKMFDTLQKLNEILRGKIFFTLRDKAHKVRNSQVNSRSKEYYDELMSRLRSADYEAWGDFLVGQVMTLGLLKITANEMKAKGKSLGEIGAYFKSVKHDMIAEHSNA